MKVNLRCRSDIKKQECMEMVLVVNEQIMGKLPLGTYSVCRYERQVSARKRASGMRCFNTEASS